MTAKEVYVRAEFGLPILLLFRRSFSSADTLSVPVSVRGNGIHLREMFN